MTWSLHLRQECVVLIYSPYLVSLYFLPPYLLYPPPIASSLNI
jgi:hypothetical protein